MAVYAAKATGIRERSGTIKSTARAHHHAGAPKVQPTQRAQHALIKPQRIALCPTRNGAAVASPGDKPCGKGVCSVPRTEPARATDAGAAYTSLLSPSPPPCGHAASQSEPSRQRRALEPPPVLASTPPARSRRPATAPAYPLVAILFPATSARASPYRRVHTATSWKSSRSELRPSSVGIRIA